MSWKERLRTIFVCLTLEVGVLFGMPMRPEEIQKLLREMSQPTLAQTLPEEEADGEPPSDGKMGGTNQTTTWPDDQMQ